MVSMCASVSVVRACKVLHIDAENWTAGSVSKMQTHTATIIVAAVSEIFKP